jgi:hypothetical protein
LFAAGAEVTANATEYLRSSQCAKAPGDFLAHFDHSDVLLALIVGKGHALVEQESQDAEIKVLQAIQQISRLALRTASLAWGQPRMAITPPAHYPAISLQGSLKLTLVELPVRLTLPMKFQ